MSRLASRGYTADRDWLQCTKKGKKYECKMRIQRDGDYMYVWKGEIDNMGLFKRVKMV
jgi:hypothetical protein